ncbi:hypothetical protein V8C35DRAFT_280800 [Trichoderma chlorosporum]
MPAKEKSTLSQPRLVIKGQTTPRRVPCQRCLQHYAYYPTDKELDEGTELKICCDDESGSQKCTRCKLGGKPCEEVSVKALAISKKIHELAQVGYTDRFIKWQPQAKKARHSMHKTSGAITKTSAEERGAMKGRAASARSVSLLKIGVDIANSLSVIAETMATQYNNTRGKKDKKVTLYKRVITSDLIEGLEDEQDEMETSIEISSDEEEKHQACC